MWHIISKAKLLEDFQIKKEIKTLTLWMFLAVLISQKQGVSDA